MPATERRTQLIYTAFARGCAQIKPTFSLGGLATRKRPYLHRFHDRNMGMSMPIYAETVYALMSTFFAGGAGALSSSRDRLPLVEAPLPTASPLSFVAWIIGILTLVTCE